MTPQTPKLEFQPYLLRIVNKTAEELDLITPEVYQSSKYYKFVLQTVEYTFDITPLDTIVFTTPEDLKIIKMYYESLGIKLEISLQGGIDYIFANEAMLNEKGSIMFVCLLIRYVFENFSIDNVLDKMNNKLEITPANELILTAKC